MSSKLKPNLGEWSEMRRKIITILGAAVLIAGGVNMPTAEAAETTTTLRFPDTIYNVNWVVELKFQQTTNCSWGTGDPSIKTAATCDFPFTYKLNWEANLSAGMKSSMLFTPSSDYINLSERLIVVNRSNKNLAGGGIFDYVSLYGMKNEVRNASLTLSSDVSTDINFALKSLFNDNLIAVTGNSAIGQLVVPSKSQAISDYAAAQAAAAAAAKAAADKAAADRQAEIDRQAAEQAAKKITITCQKGSQKKIVVGDPAKCPSGFTNPLDKYLTFQAFSACKLYKKDFIIGPAKLEDGGKTLTLSAVGKYSFVYNSLTYEDMSCALSKLGAPSFVISQINTTRALDGMQRATWGKISAAWTYHPDNGANISFNTK
jgi:hypothetical protein